MTRAEPIIRTIASMEDRLPRMDYLDMEEASDALSHLANGIDGLSDGERERLEAALQALRRALIFAREVLGNRLESASPKGSLYDAAGSTTELGSSEIQISG